MASTAGKNHRSTDVVSISALILSIFCSAGLLHVEFRLYSDRQLMNGDDLLSRRVKISPFQNEQRSDEDGKINRHDTTGSQKDVPGTSSVAYLNGDS